MSAASDFIVVSSPTGFDKRPPAVKRARRRMQTSIAHYAARTLMRVNEGKMTDECAAWRSRDVDGRGDAEKGRPRSARRPSGRRRTGGKRRQRKRAARSGVRRKARGPCREKRDGGNDERHGGRHGEDRGEKCVGMQKNR
ncbi:hypothetical protein, partial [Burkholderia pseudomallei]